MNGCCARPAVRKRSAPASVPILLLMPKYLVAILLTIPMLALGRMPQKEFSTNVDHTARFIGDLVWCSTNVSEAYRAPAIGLQRSMDRYLARQRISLEDEKLFEDKVQLGVKIARAYNDAPREQQVKRCDSAARDARWQADTWDKAK